MKTIAERLDRAIKRMPPDGKQHGVALLKRRLKGVKGATYPSIGSYLDGSTEPPVTFLRAAAPVLGVRAAWLAFGEGKPTEAQQAAHEVKTEELAERWAATLEVQFAAFAYLSDAAKFEIWRVWVRMMEVRAPAGDEKRLAEIGDRVARRLGHTLQEPLDAMHFAGVRPSRLREWQLEEYTLAICHALRVLDPLLAGDPPELSEEELVDIVTDSETEEEEAAESLETPLQVLAARHLSRRRAPDGSQA